MKVKFLAPTDRLRAIAGTTQFNKTLLFDDQGVSNEVDMSKIGHPLCRLLMRNGFTLADGLDWVETMKKAFPGMERVVPERKAGALQISWEIRW